MRIFIQVQENLKLKICKILTQSRNFRWMWLVIIVNALSLGFDFKSHSLSTRYQILVAAVGNQIILINLYSKTRMTIILYYLILFLPLWYLFSGNKQKQKQNTTLLIPDNKNFLKPLFILLYSSISPLRIL